jgi:hypothetical protein
MCRREVLQAWFKDLISLRLMQRNPPELFKGRHFDAEIIVLCVRWYLRFGLSFRNLEELMAEGLGAALCTRIERGCRRELRITNRSGRVDETYLRVAGKWTYLYRAVDSMGATIDFLLSVRRDAAAAKRFFQALQVTWPSASTGDQRGWEPLLSEGHCRTQAHRRTGPTLPVPSGSILEQHRGAGSPSHQTARESESRLPVLRLGGADDSGYRDGEHDPQGTSEVVGKG